MEANENREYSQLDKILADSFFEGVVSYLKWTSTITLAAIFWIGSNFLGLTNGVAMLIAIGSILFLFFSLMIAMDLTKRVVNLRGIEWLPVYRARLLSVMFPDDPDLIESTSQKWKKHLDTHLSGIRSPNYFSRELEYHFNSLTIGLFLYVVAFIVENMEILKIITLFS